MRYPENKVSSAEIFRLVLLKMTEFGSSFTPVHYTVLYEYLTGMNPPLTEAFNHILKTGSQVSDEDMEKIFMNFVIPELVLPLIDQRDSLTKDIQSLLEKIAESTTSTTHETEKFQKGLEFYRNALKSNNVSGAASLMTVINAVMKDTGSMKNATNLLEVKLNESRREIEELQKELHTARVDALVDPLTQLMNRRGLDLYMAKMTAGGRLKGEDCAFLMLDIDSFKKVNDVHGHMVGDKVIQAVARVLSSVTRGEDIAARMGGEEFAVILTKTTIQQAHMQAEHIRRNVEKIEILSAKTRENFGGITISIGIDSVPKEGKGKWQTAMERADRALYQSKTAGRNRTTIYFSDAT